MKTLKKKTLMMALFGLLAANASWNLIDKNGANYFAGQKVMEEGSVSFASEGLDAVQSQSSDFKVSDNREEMMVRLTKEISRQENAIMGDPSYTMLSTEEDHKLGRYKIKVTDLGQLDNGDEWYKWLRSEEARGRGISLEFVEDDAVDWIESKENEKDIIITFHKYFELKDQKIDGKKYDVRFDLIGDDKTLAGKNLKYRATLVDSEGEVLGDCETCHTIDLLSIEEDKLEDVDHIAAILEKALKRKSDVVVEKRAERLARTCESKKHRAGSDKQLECLIDRLEGKSKLAKKLNSEEEERVEVLLGEILTEEYMDDPRSDDFNDLFRGNPKFKALAKRFASEAKTQIAKEERYERESERTEMMEDALRDELDYLNDAMYALDERAANFENMYSYASRDIDQQRMQCDSSSPYSSTTNSRRYFDGGYAGMSFDFKDGFQTYSGNTRSRSMLTSPQTNMMGGTNQYAMWQNQWEQMNRQNAEMIRQNCLQNLATVENYWNWELANYEDTYVKPLQQEISSKINRLDINRIFPTVYRDEDDNNGGIYKDDKDYYASMIRDFKQDLNGMGIQSGSTNNSILYSTPRSGSTVSGNNTSSRDFRSGGTSIPTTTGNNRGRTGTRGI